MESESVVICMYVVRATYTLETPFHRNFYMLLISLFVDNPHVVFALLNAMATDVRPNALYRCCYYGFRVI